MGELLLGVPATSSKENEQRLPIHPEHIERIEPELRARMLVERGYGERLGVSDDVLANLGLRLAPRATVIAESDIVLLPKPMLADVAALRSGQVLWGWPHAVQDVQLTQTCIDNRLTLIAWEAMNHWSASGHFVVHVFHMNNELAGYASVVHALTLRGMTGHYGRPLTAAVIGFGNTARGAINALKGLGIHDITALTMREITEVASPIPTVVLEHLDRSESDRSRTIVDTESGPVPMVDFLAGHDIIVNCVLQDTDDPFMFVSTLEASALKQGTVIVDVSCDEGMGFEFARPTSFDDPMLFVGDGVAYYGVDHSPSYLWNSATWDISEALLPYLPAVMAGPSAWDDDLTISRAIEIRDGIIQNPKILSFQGRPETFPHAPDR